MSWPVTGSPAPAGIGPPLAKDGKPVVRPDGYRCCRPVKAKIALEALREQATVADLAVRYQA